MTQLAQVRPDKARARKARHILGQCLRSAIQNHGDDLAGFALVTWDMRGGAHSSYLVDVGPIAESLMPLYAKDALDRHVAVRLAQDVVSERIDGT